MPLGLVVTMTLTMLLVFGFLFGLLAAVGLYFNLSGLVVVGLAVLMLFFQWFIGPKIIKFTTNMREMNKDEYGWAQEFVAKICKKHGLKPPKMFLVNDGNPNAFVFGLTNKSANLCVTNGLMKNLSKDEVKAVLAHEIGHMKHNDMVVMVIVAAIPILAFYVARFLVFAPKRGRTGVGYMILVGIAAWVIYFVTNLLVMFFSRMREYYADRFGGMNSDPSHLASALAKITYGLGISKTEFNSAARSFFIADPYTSRFEVSHFSSEFSDLNITKDEVRGAILWEKKNAWSRISEVFRTHPLTWKRIKELHNLQEEISNK